MAEVSRQLQSPYSQNSNTIWMHCASLGEFEQGRPLLEMVRSFHPEYRIVVTFFSPSGFEVRKTYKGADHIFYLPMDSAKNAKLFIQLVNPKLVLWIKYEFWHYYLTELHHHHVPTLLISGAFREGQRFFKSFSNFWRNMLHSFTYIFLQNESSASLLSKINIIDNVAVSGDTRFDRVISISENFEPVDLIELFCNQQQVIVAGSTWEEDEAVFIHYVRSNPSKKFILAPHEIDQENLHDIKKQFSNAIFYSELKTRTAGQNHGSAELPNVLIIDCIGILSRLYKYATIAYIGGGFGDDGLHNILEAAVYGKPVIFGPEIDKNAEASEMIRAGGAVRIENALQLETVMNELLNDTIELKVKSEAAKNYIYSNAGATQKIWNYIKENQLL